MTKFNTTYLLKVVAHMKLFDLAKVADEHLTWAKEEMIRVEKVFANAIEERKRARQALANAETEVYKAEMLLKESINFLATAEKVRENVRHETNLLERQECQN